MKTTTIRVDVGPLREVDGLCKTCLLPALVEVDLLHLRDQGVSTFGMALFCVECRELTNRA